MTTPKSRRKSASRKAAPRRAATAAPASGGVPADQVGEVVQGYVDDRVGWIEVQRLADGSYRVTRRI